MNIKEIERDIRNELSIIRKQIKSGEESEIVIWIIKNELACSQRPLRDHPEFGGRDTKALDANPEEARDLVANWVKRLEKMGIRSIICLLEEDQLKRYYSKPGLHERGLLGYYESRGLVTRHFALTDYQRPSEENMKLILEIFDELPKPVLIHCSAAIDRTTPVGAFIFYKRGKLPFQR